MLKKSSSRRRGGLVGLPCSRNPHDEAVVVRRAQLGTKPGHPLKEGNERAWKDIVGCSLRPCLGQGASLGEEAVLADSGRAGEVAARGGRVRNLDFLSILNSFRACEVTR